MFKGMHARSSSVLNHSTSCLSFSARCFLFCFHQVIKWMLHNRVVVRRYFEMKQFVSQPSAEWWMLAYVVNDFLVNVSDTFKTLQVESAGISKQYLCLRLLCMILETVASMEHIAERSMEEPLMVAEGAASVSKGQFIAGNAGIDEMMRGIDVVSANLHSALLRDWGRKVVSLASAVMYLSALHGLTVVLAGLQATGRESLPSPHASLRNWSTHSMLILFLWWEVTSNALRSCFGDAFLPQVCQQHKNLVRIVAQEAPLSSQLHAKKGTNMVLSKSWAPCGPRFKELRLFAAGLATVMPTTSRVEGDFSLMCYRRNIYASGLTDFALEGSIYAKQYDDLQVAVSKYNVDQVNNSLYELVKEDRKCP